MPASAQTFFTAFFRDLALGRHNLSAHDFKLGLTNFAPQHAAYEIFNDVEEIAEGGGYPLGGFLMPDRSLVAAGDLVTLRLGQYLLTATDDVARFRWAVLYNATSVGERLVCSWDYGEEADLGVSDTMLFAPSDVVIRIGAGG
jgi:hypothetical protein